MTEAEAKKIYIKQACAVLELFGAMGPRALAQVLHGAAMGNHIRLSDDQRLRCIDAAKVLRGEQ